MTQALAQSLNSLREVTICGRYLGLAVGQLMYFVGRWRFKRNGPDPCLSKAYFRKLVGKLTVSGYSCDPITHTHNLPTRNEQVEELVAARGAA